MTLPEGFKVIPTFPHYMAHEDGTIRHIEKGFTCRTVRISKKTGAKIVVVTKDGKKYTRAVPELVEAAFGEPPVIRITYEMYQAGIDIGDTVDGKKVVE